MSCDNTYVQIDLDAIRDNLRAVHEKSGCNVMAVVKADAYGHGAVHVARHLRNDCSFFGVSSVAEAMELVMEENIQAEKAESAEENEETKTTEEKEEKNGNSH